jgi:hypothetical protein
MMIINKIKEHSGEITVVTFYEQVSNFWGTVCRAPGFTIIERAQL